MTNKSGDFPPHEVTSLLPICFWEHGMKSTELSNSLVRQKNVKQQWMACRVRKLRATMCGSIEFPADQVPRKAGDKIRFWILPPTMFTQVLTKSKLRNKNQETIWFVVFFSCKQANTIKFPADQALRKAADKIRFWVFASSNVYTSLTQIQNPNAKNTKSYASCKHASTIKFPADQACLGKQKIRRAVHHRQQQVCTKLMMFYWVCNNLVNK